VYYAYTVFCFGSFPTDSKDTVLISTLIPLGAFLRDIIITRGELLWKKIK
jgi:hypothetical protein